MGDLIVMTRPAVPPRRHMIAGAEAEILFFTGVRYARMAEEEPIVAVVRTPRMRSAKPRKPTGKRASPLTV